MTKYEKNIAEAPIVDNHLEQLVKKAILAYMAANDDAIPTIAELNQTKATSTSKLCTATKAVKSRIVVVQSKLVAMPDIPEELSLPHD